MAPEPLWILMLGLTHPAPLWILILGRILPAPLSILILGRILPALLSIIMLDHTHLASPSRTTILAVHIRRAPQLLLTILMNHLRVTMVPRQRRMIMMACLPEHPTIKGHRLAHGQDISPKMDTKPDRIRRGAQAQRLILHLVEQ
jgi:hypothetical protein